MLRTRMLLKIYFFFSSTDDFLLNVSKRCLLPEECRIWLDHLQTVVDNRRRGAKKAAETRRSKKVDTPWSQVFYHQYLQEQPVHPLLLDLLLQLPIYPLGLLRPHPASSTSIVTPVTTFCLTCGEEKGEDGEIWIGCDLCDNWYHLSCEGLPTDEIFLCGRC